MLGPGISLAGSGATLCILYAIFYAFVYVGTTAGWISGACSALGIALVTVWFMRSKTVDRLALKKTLDYKPDPLKGLDLKAGDTGTTVTRLTLIGNADFNGNIVEVQSTDGFIDEKTPVEIVRINNGTVYVRPTGGIQNR